MKIPLCRLVPGQTRYARALAALLLAVAIDPLSAQDKDKSVEPLPPEVEGILQAMSAQLREAKTFVVHANILSDEETGDGQTFQRAAKLNVLIQRPGSVHAVFTSDTNKRKMWLDGKTATLYDVDANMYARTRVPAKIGPAFDHLMDRYGISLPLSDFFTENPYEALTGSVQKAVYDGTWYKPFYSGEEVVYMITATPEGASS